MKKQIQSRTVVLKKKFVESAGQDSIFSQMRMERGKVFLLLLLLLVLIVNCSSNEEDRQEIQLKKLESLVENLTQLINRLESSLKSEKAVSEEVGEISSYKVHGGKADLRLSKNEEDRDDKISPEEEEKEEVQGSFGALVTKYNPSWYERFHFLSAVKLESESTCIDVLPFQDYEGCSKYIAVGDERGRLYVFLSNGDLLLQFHTSSEFPITAMLSYMSLFKNQSVLVTGHQNGVILIHHIWEVSNGGEDWHSLSIQNFRSSPPPPLENRSPVTILELHQFGRMRYILASDLTHNIRVLRENGTLYGCAISKARPLAFLKQRLLFLTENGAGSLDLRSMKVRESECEGMNHSLATNYVFDVTERSKAYGFTSEGDLIHVVLLGDAINFKCRVRSKRKVEMDGGALAFQAIKGYLLIASEDKVFVYNISSQHYIRVGAPRPLFSATLDEIRSSFLNQVPKSSEPRGAVVPLMATDGEKLIVVGLGSGYVGMYRSNLPVFSTEFNTVLWTSPVLVFLVFLFGVWHFFGKKKESLTSWGTEDPYSSSTMTGSGERPFADSSSSSRNADLRDLRGGALRAAPSRRYPGGGGGAAAIPYRTNSTEPNFRTSSTDHNFRAATELKYRGASLDAAAAAGFAKRRETLFPNNQSSTVEASMDDMS